MKFPMGSRLLAKITPLERERNILIVGHRLEPYRAQNVAPWDVKIATERGEALVSRSVPMALKKAGIFYTFFGAEELFAFLAAQESDNAETMANVDPDANDAIVRVEAFDMQSFYAEAELAAGDYLDFELADESGARFILRPLKARDIPAERRTAWFRDLDRGREAAMLELGRPVAPIAFIAATFAAAPASLRKKPSAAFSEYYNESQTLQIREFAGSSFMWTKGTDIPALLLSGEPPEYETGEEDDELTRSLAALGFALNSDEIAAFVRDALWRGQGVEDALGRCFAGAAELGLPKKKLAALMAQVRAFARNIAVAWDGSAENAEVAHIRSALLDMYAAFLDWMRRIGGLVRSPSDLDTEEFSLLSEAMQNVCDLIVAFGPAKAETNDGLAEISRQMSTLAEMTNSLMESIEAELGGKRSPRRGSSPSAAGGSGKKSTKSDGTSKGKRRSRPASDKLYTFEARIADIEPPIRRLIVVPGNRSLADLHQILQTAFGWTDSHLHLFKIRGEAYGEPSPEDYEPLLDERKIRLDALSLRARSKIEYVYDYGDDWEHELVVVATKKAAPGMELPPLCLEAERASPPEDCGGSPGYESLVEALALPEDERDEEQSEFVVWAGGWEPERCDLDLINRDLEKL